MSRSVVIDERSFVDRKRYVCPNNHTSWERTNNHFWCAACSKSWDVDPEFNYLHDKVTNKSIHRSQVRFLE